jgi:hypothetical protein
MSREGDLMRKALQRLLVPELRRLGFRGTNPKFQRKSPEWLDLLSIQYSKYGGEFVLEFTRRERGPLHTSWGETVPEERLNVGYVHPTQRARLEQRGPTSGEGLRGFKFSGFGEHPVKYDELAAQVAALLPQVEEWLRSAKAGDHVHSFRAAS